MSRPSVAALSVVAFEPAQRRPEPPDNLSKEAAQHWNDIVNSMPPDWFPRSTHPMLSQLCRAIVRCNDVAEAIEKAKRHKEDLSARNYQNLMRVEMQLSNSIAHLSTKMRISQQSSTQYDKKRNRDGRKNVPWEAHQDEAS